MANLEEGRESIVTRLSKLNQLLVGRGSSLSVCKSLVSHDGLLDALLVLYDECSKDLMTKNQHTATFVKKCELS
jgi:citron Rho-interacting kinase